ncbi:MAG: hypothetical protein EXS55_02700 [Candidatus Magasanikbacteria bacterium]|nr:hypothetical protein [Candidatus Magasanikbacteria bacterium]
MRTHWLRVLTILALLAWYIFFLAWPINLIRADLGRHIKNGEILLSSPLHSWRPLLTTNFYSYTFPNSPFINHHWGSGVVFYLVHHASGFNGLSIFVIAVNIATLAFFWLSARRYVSFAQAAFISFLLIPFMAERYEVRPEIFSFLFIGIYWYILDGYRTNMIQDKMLWLLPLFQALWINLHVYFFFGFVLLAAFVIESLIQKNSQLRPGRLVTVGVAMIVTACLNPSFLKGFFYPFTIFNNYGLALEENTPLISHLRLVPGYVNGWICLLVALTVMILTLLALMKNRRSIPVSYWLVGSFIFLLVFKSVRNISFLAFFGFTFIAFLIHTLRPASPPQENRHQTYEPMAGGRHCCCQLSHTLS